jgi:hypothetical protein
MWLWAAKYELAGCGLETVVLRDVSHHISCHENLSSGMAILLEQNFIAMHTAVNVHYVPTYAQINGVNLC